MPYRTASVVCSAIHLIHLDVWYILLVTFELQSNKTVRVHDHAQFQMVAMQRNIVRINQFSAIAWNVPTTIAHLYYCQPMKIYLIFICFSLNRLTVKMVQMLVFVDGILWRIRLRRKKMYKKQQQQTIIVTDENATMYNVDTINESHYFVSNVFNLRLFIWHKMLFQWFQTTLSQFEKENSIRNTFSGWTYKNGICSLVLWTFKRFATTHHVIFSDIIVSFVLSSSSSKETLCSRPISPSTELLIFTAIALESSQSL